jgi:DNA-binding NtrC family response regulator
MSRHRVLVADESAEIANLEAALFSVHGHNVDIVRDAETALRRLATLEYDVCVVGEPMTVAQDGEKRFFLDVLIERFEKNLPRTIIVTAAPDDRALLDRAARARAFAILPKPLDIVGFIECVDACIAGRSPSRTPPPSRR